MRKEEAVAIADWVRNLGLPSGAVCLNIGSSTADFRTNAQPHIDLLLMQPLLASGLKVVHCDMKAAEGVDEVGDLLDPCFQERLKRYNADLLICSNLLEHLTNPREFAVACGQLVKPGGYGLFTVPASYPYHPDPIDTMLRLQPNELADLMPEWELVRAQRLDAGNHLIDLRQHGDWQKRLLKQIVRVLLPIYRPSSWKPLAHRLLWLFRPFRQSMVLLRKPVSATSELPGAEPQLVREM